jgi:glycosyltransferase involved in cell wall biosynthesis
MKNNLTLIIPNYNNDLYIDDCLKSVVSQTRTPDEVIVIDDASTDNSLNIIKKYEKKYNFIKLIQNKKNKGVVFTRNKAIKLAKGNYITTLDSDDFYLDNMKLEVEMKIIQNYKEKGEDVIAFSNIVSVNKDKNPLKSYNNIEEGDIFFEILTRNNFIPRDFIFKKDDFFSIGGYKHYPLYEDWDLKIKLASIRNFYFTDCDGIAYRQHTEGLSSANYKEHYKWLKKIFHKNVKRLNLNQKVYAYLLFYKFLFKYRLTNGLKQYPNIYSFIKNNYKKIKGEDYEK